MREVAVARPKRCCLAGLAIVIVPATETAIATAIIKADVTYAQRILDFLWSIAPDGATNGQIARHLGIASQQTVYLATQDLLRRGLIRSARTGRTFLFFAVEDEEVRLARPGPLLPDLDQPLTPAAFAALARRTLSAHYGAALSPGVIPGVRKQFALVSPDRQIVGHALCYHRVGSTGLPSAKYAIFAEHLWLLEQTGAPATFLVFGNDRQVPALWLARYGNLLSGPTFYFLTDDGQLEVLAGPARLPPTS